jgi:hypothetical protein
MYPLRAARARSAKVTRSIPTKPDLTIPCKQTRSAHTTDIGRHLIMHNIKAGTNSNCKGLPSTNSPSTLPHITLPVSMPYPSISPPSFSFVRQLSTLLWTIIVSHGSFPTACDRNRMPRLKDHQPEIVPCGLSKKASAPGSLRCKKAVIQARPSVTRAVPATKPSTRQ